MTRWGVISNPPSASTSLYFDHSHFTNSTSSPSSLKKPFSTAMKIGASQVMPIYPTRILAGPEAASVGPFLQPLRSNALEAAMMRSFLRDIKVGVLDKKPEV